MAMHLLHIIWSLLSAFWYALGFVQVCSLIWQLLARIPKHITNYSNFSVCLHAALCLVLQPVLPVSASFRCQLQ